MVLEQYDVSALERLRGYLCGLHSLQWPLYQNQDGLDGTDNYCALQYSVPHYWRLDIVDIVDCCGHWQNEHYRSLTIVARTENVQISDAIRGEKFYYLEKIRFPEFFSGNDFLCGKLYFK